MSLDAIPDGARVLIDANVLIYAKRDHGPILETRRPTA